MYERFTDRVHEVMRLANEEAFSFGKDGRIDTHHILLGMLKVGAGVATQVLDDRGINVSRVRAEIERLGECGSYEDRQGKLPMTAAAKNVVENSLEEAALLKHSYVGTEHLLLALLRDPEGVATQVFRALAVQPEAIRADILSLHGHGLDG